METKKQHNDLKQASQKEDINSINTNMPEVLKNHAPATDEEELELRKQRTHFASSKPDKNHVG